MPNIARLTSPYPFAETVQRLLGVLAAKDIKVFATLDQQAEARAVGLAMPPTTLIVFGSPKVGTPLMLACPQAGVDLPLKVLVSEAEPGRVAVFFTPAAEIVRRHRLGSKWAASLESTERLIAGVLGSEAQA